MNAPMHHSEAVRTTCPYCGVGCGLLVQPNARGGAIVAGDPQHPANAGQLCSKGSALAETVGLEGRLLHPMLRNAHGALAHATWDEALVYVAHEFSRIVARDGPDAVALYLSGQLLTEDYYVANKLMKGFIGSANVDTNSRLCMASSVAGHRRAFGSDTVPGSYADLDEADLLVLVGSNAAWCHPVLYRRMVRNKAERGAKIVVIDPRRTATAEEADLFLPIQPGTDTALFAGLLVHLSDTAAIDPAYIGRHTVGFGEALAAARAISPDLQTAARATGLPIADVAQFFELFRVTSRVVTCFSQGVNQSAQGTDKVNAIINCHLATGRIGKPGMGPFSLTGQPNAMGGREVGGLANQLAAHMGFAADDVDRVRRFWNAPRMAAREGLKAVQMFEAIADGKIKALWVMATNPVVSLPRANMVREALRKLELFVVSDNVASNDTIAVGPHALLPAAAWGEKDGTVTNSERRISRQRAFLPIPGEARADWWIVSQVARRMGFAEAFSYASPAEIFREHAALSAFENDGARDFDLGALASLTDAEYDALPPVQWGAARFFGEGGFFYPDRRARFVAVKPPALREPTSEAYPFRLNTGRIRDQWHSMTRTGRSARLATHLPEPFVEVSVQDAAALGIADGDFARVTTPHGVCTARVVVSEGQQSGSLFMPIHWSETTASDARVGALVSAHTDPHSGQPELKATPAAIAAAEFRWRGFVRARTPFALPPCTFWARIVGNEGVEYRIASNAGPMLWHDFAHRLCPADAQLAEELDPAAGAYRAAVYVDGALEGYVWIVPSRAMPSDRLDLPLPDATEASAQSRLNAATILDSEPVVCACFGVSAREIRAAIENDRARSVVDVGRILRAGLNCGSCLPELKRIVTRVRRSA
jgi:assimilatory nitrate reductase catalytic subunit